MRLDKFLKLSRIVKRRTIANELCDLGCASINNKVVKAATEVKVGDILSLRFGNRALTVRIETVPLKAVPAQLADQLYVILSEERKDI